MSPETITGRLASVEVDDYYVALHAGAESRALTVRAVVTGPGWRLEIEKLHRDERLPAPGDLVHVVSDAGGRLRLEGVVETSS